MLDIAPNLVVFVKTVSSLGCAAASGVRVMQQLRIIGDCSRSDCLCHQLSPAAICCITILVASTMMTCSTA